MSSDSQYVADLKEAGWNPATITILVQVMAGGRATVADASAWKLQFQPEGDVLYDNEWTWADLSLIDRWSGSPMDGMVAFPWTLVVHTAHMRVWYLYGGFAGPPDYEQWWLQQQLDVFEYCGTESGVL